jgi:hypothetical protein
VAEGLRSDGGGIVGLHRLLEEHGEAIEYDLLDHQFRLDDLGTEALSWRDLFVLIRRWQKLPETATCEAVHGRRWTTTEQLLAGAVDVLQAANWQRAGKKTAAKPKPVPRPWEQSRTQAIGKDPIAIGDFDVWWESQSRK